MSPGTQCSVLLCYPYLYIFATIRTSKIQLLTQSIYNFIKSNCQLEKKYRKVYIIRSDSPCCHLSRLVNVENLLLFEIFSFDYYFLSCTKGRYSEWSPFSNYLRKNSEIWARYEEIRRICRISQLKRTLVYKIKLTTNIRLSLEICSLAAGEINASFLPTGLLCAGGSVGGLALRRFSPVWCRLCAGWSC